MEAPDPQPACGWTAPPAVGPQDGGPGRYLKARLDRL